MLAAVAITFALALAEERPRAVVLDLAGEDDELAVRRALAAKVAARLASDGRLDVLSADDVRGLATMEAERQAAGCDESCLAELAGALDARFLVAGTLGRVGALSVVSLTLFDADEMRSVSRTTVEAERKEALLGEMDDAAAQLLAALPLGPSTSSGPGLVPLALVSGGGVAVVLGGVGLAGAGQLLLAQAEQREALDDAAARFAVGDDEDDLADANASYAEARSAYRDLGVPLFVAGGIAVATGAVLAGVGGALWAAE